MRSFAAYTQSLHNWTDNHPMPTAASNGYAAASIASPLTPQGAGQTPATTIDVLMQQMVLLAAAVTQNNRAAQPRRTPASKPHKGQKQCMTHKLCYHESKDCKTPSDAHRLTGIHNG